LYLLRHRLWGPQSPMQWAQVLKRSGREADQSPLPNAEVKNAWSYTSTPSYMLLN